MKISKIVGENKFRFELNNSEKDEILLHISKYSNTNYPDLLDKFLKFSFEIFLTSGELVAIYNAISKSEIINEFSILFAKTGIMNPNWNPFTDKQNWTSDRNQSDRVSKWNVDISENKLNNISGDFYYPPGLWKD